MDDQSCGFAGNSDIYGLGIPLGLYLQWVSAVHSKRYLASPESILELTRTDTVFLLAISIATAVLSSGSIGEPRAVEILIMLHIFFGDIYIVWYDKDVRINHENRQSTAGVTLRITMITCMSVLGVWFWFTGLDKFVPAPCASFAFLFARVALDGRARIFYKVASVINMAFWGATSLLTVCSTIVSLLRLIYKLALAFGLTLRHLKLQTTSDRTRDFSRDHSDSHVRYRLTKIISMLFTPIEKRKLPYTESSWWYVISILDR
jgi:hypothetical protein